jgi:hypothetical protein
MSSSSGTEDSTDEDEQDFFTCMFKIIFSQIKNTCDDVYFFTLI